MEMLGKRQLLDNIITITTTQSARTTTYTVAVAPPSPPPPPPQPRFCCVWVYDDAAAADGY